MAFTKNRCILRHLALSFQKYLGILSISHNVFLTLSKYADVEVVYCTSLIKSIVSTVYAHARLGANVLDVGLFRIALYSPWAIARADDVTKASCHQMSWERHSGVSVKTEACITAEEDIVYK